MHDQYCKARCHRQAGLTLVELMIAIGIIAILATIAVPNIINWLPNYRAKAAARDIISNFQKAKMEAVKRNRDVVITFTTTQAGSYWIFVDDDGDGNFTAGERVLAQVNMPKDVFLYNTTFTGDKTGYNSRALPVGGVIGCGSVEIRNNKLIIHATRYYQATLSFAGNVKLRMSSDGATWN